MRARHVTWLFAFLVTLTLGGCKTKTLVQTEYVHDSVFLRHDSIVTRFVVDSTLQRENTVIFTVHDTANGKDTVFVVREKNKERWRVKTDTVTLWKERGVYHEEQSTKKEQIQKKDKTWIGTLIGLLLGVLIAWLISYYSHLYASR